MSDIRHMVARILECNINDLNPQSGMGTFPGWDSFAHLNIMMELEREFGVEISDESIEQFSKLAAIETLGNSKKT